MVFCGHCGYQLGSQDKICPRCGNETDIDIDLDLIAQASDGGKQPTEPSQVIQNAPLSEHKPGVRSPTPTPPQPAGPLVLRPSDASYLSEQAANSATTMMVNAPVYPTYPPQANMYGYHAGNQAYYQFTALARILDASQRGKTNALLLILFGLLLLIAAIIVFLLNQQGIIFSG